MKIPAENFKIPEFKKSWNFGILEFQFGILEFSGLELEIAKFQPKIPKFQNSRIPKILESVSYTHLTLPTNREV